MKEEHLIEKKIEGKEWKELVEKAYTKLLKDFSIKGYRKGKVPKEKFIAMGGEYKARMEALELVLDSLYQEALLEVDNDRILERPEMELKELDDNKAIVNFKFLLNPMAKIVKCSGFNVKKTTSDVTSEEVQEEIKKVLDRYSELEVVEESAKNGDVLDINFEGKLNGEVFEGGKAEHYTLELGSKTFIPGFEEELIGLKAGKEKTFNIKFPEDYHAEALAGKDTEFTVKINEVKRHTKVEINKDLFADMGRDDLITEDDFIKDIEKQLKEQKKQAAEEEYKMNILSKIVEANEIPVLDEKIKTEKENMKHMFSNQMYGINMDDYYKMMGMSEEQIAKIDEDMTKTAERNIKYRYAIKELMKKLNIAEPTDEEVLAATNKFAKEEQMTMEDLHHNYPNLNQLKEQVKVDKLFEELIKINESK